MLLGCVAGLPLALYSLGKEADLAAFALYCLIPGIIGAVLSIVLSKKARKWVQELFFNFPW